MSTCRISLGGLHCTTQFLVKIPAIMTYFLEYDAKVDALTECGATPLHRTIEYNSHECLKILLKAGAGCGFIQEDGNSTLHIAAAFADEATLRILRSTEISVIDCDLENNQGQTSSDVFWEWHSEHYGNGLQGWVDAFKGLLDKMREENLKLASSSSDTGLGAQNGNHTGGSDDDTAISNPPVPGALVLG